MWRRRQIRLGIRFEYVLAVWYQGRNHQHFWCVITAHNINIKWGLIYHFTGPASFTRTRTIVKQTNPIIAALRSINYDSGLMKVLTEAFASSINEPDENGSTPLMIYVVEVSHVTAYNITIWLIIIQVFHKIFNLTQKVMPCFCALDLIFFE